MPIYFGAGPSTLPPDYPELAGWLAALAAVLALVAYFMAEGRPALRRWAWYAAFTSIGIAD
jgi:hypothetical protein